MSWGTCTTALLALWRSTSVRNSKALNFPHLPLAALFWESNATGRPETSQCIFAGQKQSNLHAVSGGLPVGFSNHRNKWPFRSCLSDEPTRRKPSASEQLAHGKDGPITKYQPAG